LGHLGNSRHPDERRQEFVRSNLAGLRGGMKASVASLLSCLWAGFTVAAKRWESRPEGWTIAALDLLHPLTLFPTSGGGGNEADRQGMRTDETGEVVGFRQFSTRAGEPPVDFEREDVLYWPFMQEVREEVYGKRLTDKARRSWFMRTKIERFWAVHLEKFAHPIPIFRVPKGTQVGRPATTSATPSSTVASSGISPPARGSPLRPPRMTSSHLTCSRAAAVAVTHT
jgi:hypothetical protein